MSTEATYHKHQVGSMRGAIDGGKGLYADRPRKENWKEYGFDFRIIQPILGYFRHSFPVQDPSAPPARQDGTKPTWHMLYCLASPSQQDFVELQPVPERIAECRSIIIPGTNVGLHDCEQLERGTTDAIYRAVILNWQTKVLQIWEYREYAWAELFASLNLEVDRLAALGKRVNLSEYDWRVTCIGGTSPDFPYRVQIGPCPARASQDYPVEEARRIYAESGERLKEIEAAFNPAMSAQQIMKIMGVTTATPYASAAGGDLFGEGGASDDPFGGPLPPDNQPSRLVGGTEDSPGEKSIF